MEEGQGERVAPSGGDASPLVMASFKSFTGTDDKVRFNVVVLANCRNDPERVRRVLHDLAISHLEMLLEPEPEAWVDDQFGNNVVSYRLHM